MPSSFYQDLTTISLKDEIHSDPTCEKILSDTEIELLPLLNAAYQVRKTYHNNTVQLHILNNAQNGNCPEDCYYCVQAKTATTGIDTYSLKPESEILAEAENAFQSGAYRYCIVMSGRGPSSKRVRQMANIIRTIKKHFPIEVCLSVGLIDEPAAHILKEAGLDRLNHNLNTSESHYPNICTTHTYQDRMDTLQAAQTAGLACCSGVIVGMGEDVVDLIRVAKELRRLDVASIPVNFFLPIEGTQLSEIQLLEQNGSSNLTPDFCLRVLCLFRFLNPRSEIRVAAGREHHLRGMEVMSLYPANSMFIDGYLNAEGTSASRTLQMIQDAGFTIEANGEILDNQQDQQPKQSSVLLKELPVLRPRLESNN
jgi:biotin synthase